ncbi:MAG TPA: hypothetical protein VGI12_17590 [Vicinamibacterales bacterium]
MKSRAALAVALLVAWLNFLLTMKWAAYDGALNGWKRPWYAAALLAATVLVAIGKDMGRAVRAPWARWLFAGGWVWLTVVLFVTLPPATWRLIPFADDWVPRFQGTADGVALLRHGAVVGWQWAFLGGYWTSGDLGQTLTLIGAIPMTLFGDRVGYHLLHALLVFGIPLIVYLDIRADGRRDVAWLAGFFTLLCVVGMFGTLMPNGDTNSIAGVFCAMVALGGRRLARLGWRGGDAVTLVGLTLALYTHTAFFGYALVYLAVDAAFYRDWRSGVRIAVIAAVALIAAAPQFVELVLYPRFYLTNNVIYAPGPIGLSSVAHQVYYNVEILLHPHRWFNDYMSLTNVFLVVIAWTAFRGDGSRPHFYAWAALATMAMLRLNVREAGYLFAREMHMLAALTPAPLAWFVCTQSGSRRLALALTAIVGLYPQTTLAPLAHVDSIREFDAALVDRLSALDGHLVLLEASPHLDLNAEPGRQSERTPFAAHFEALLPAATGRRFYGQQWDTWHWTPLRGQVIAAGAFRGTFLSRTPPEALQAELRRWGVRHLVVWSVATKAYLDAAPLVFTRKWSSGRWIQYELADADERSVAVETGAGRLVSSTPLDARVALSGVRRDETVVVRTNYFPAWRADAAGADVSLFPLDGQLAFRAPRDGDYAVDFHYPRRTGLLLFAMGTFVAGAVLLSVGKSQRRHPAAA